MRKIKIPLLVVLAGKDEFRDRDIKEIADWFESNLASESPSIITVQNASHGFKKKENIITDLVRDFMR